MNIDLQAPIWAIEHVAAAFFVESVDTAREHTYRPDFPAAKAGFSRNLWDREEVLAWFRQLPAREPAKSSKSTARTTPRTSTQTTSGRTSAGSRPRHGGRADRTPPATGTAAPVGKTVKPYRPQGSR